jgi:uncharacterized protein
MGKSISQAHVDAILHELAHLLPAQAPLKDFVHHNTLHAFQHKPFHEALQMASENFGYKVYLSLKTYRDLYRQKKINEAILDNILMRQKGADAIDNWKNRMLHDPEQQFPEPHVGSVRRYWREVYHLNLDKEVHQNLFRLISAYLDQGIGIWKFPFHTRGFLSGFRELEKNSFSTFVSSERARRLLIDSETSLTDLLKILVGEEKWYGYYMRDQQFAHPGWSGMVAVLEHQKGALLDKRKISLHDLVFVECILEIDALDRRRGENWTPIGPHIREEGGPLVEPSEYSAWYEIHRLWQEAMEWTYYDQVIRGLQMSHEADFNYPSSIQAIFCIDDRNCSVRRYVERFIPHARTYGTAGFFNLPFYFQPEHGKFLTKVCPAPVDPGHVIRETESTIRHERDVHFSRHSKGILGAWAISQTMGFWSAIKMAGSIFFPSETPAMVSSFRHMDPDGKLSIVCEDKEQRYQGLQIGFTEEEMTDALEGMLRSMGLIKEFAPIIYIFGHGASSVNNTHYAGYDCGACSGRAGSVNARVAAAIGNHPVVRRKLAERGIEIPKTTQFVGGLHDTTRDELAFYDLNVLTTANRAAHEGYLPLFEQALNYNAKERSRRFHTINSKQEARKVHEAVKKRALSLFETRPEWNHATNALCIIGKRDNNRHLFLDKRSFLNSYDYSTDPEGNYLLSIIKAVAPVCGGINLEYYFSKVDHERLGAGSKLPHNVMGLIGVANGMDGDLRTGLPLQMVNIHDPLRILITVDHYPEVVLKVIQTHEPTYEWFLHEWVRLVCIHPETRQAFVFSQGRFEAYKPLSGPPKFVNRLDEILENSTENLPVYQIA